MTNRLAIRDLTPSSIKQECANMSWRSVVIRFVCSIPFLVFVVLAGTACNTPPERRNPTVPQGAAYADGQEILFMHTEVSDPGIAEKLTKMMNSPVLTVPALAKVPPEALAKVYVFSNGIKGKGPLGFQADVFDNPPGTDGYRPLRDLNVVTWKDANASRELKSAAEVLDFDKKGDVTIERPGVVINMPFVRWVGGQR
jgi:hypothetical protein